MNEKMIAVSPDTLKRLTQGTGKSLLSGSGLLEFDSHGVKILVSHSEKADSPKVFISIQDGDSGIVPSCFNGIERQVLSRMTSFIDRIRMGSLPLPKNWSPYQDRDLISFTAVNSDRHKGLRWICQVEAAEDPVIIFREVATAEKRLEDLRYPPINRDFISGAWAAQKAFYEKTYNAVTSQEPVELTRIKQPHRSPQSFDYWSRKLSPKQRDFLVKPANQSIKLRGPAGSGKSVSLALRAYLLATELAPKEKTLVVTHSWASAYDIDALVEGCGHGQLDNIDIMPLLDLAKEITPSGYQDLAGYQLASSDSSKAIAIQLGEVDDALQDFIASDWPTYRRSSSQSFRDRMDAEDDQTRKALVWDLMVEFGSVLGAARIIPGRNALQKYRDLSRGPWMMDLDKTSADIECSYAIYVRFRDSLEARGLISVDQFYADTLGFLESNAWARLRRTAGYDSILIDEFHLYSPLERFVIQNLSRDPSGYPVVSTASDPSQSAAAYFLNTNLQDAATSSEMELDLGGNEEEIDLTVVHRYSEEILRFIKHIDAKFPVLDLGGLTSTVSSSQAAAKGENIPRVLTYTSDADELENLDEVISTLPSGDSRAIIVLDEQKWSKVFDWTNDPKRSKKIRLVDGPSDVEGLQYSSAQVAVILAEAAVGLEFDHVVVAGLPTGRRADTTSNIAVFLSRLYVASSRAIKSLTILRNPQDDGLDSVLDTAIDAGILRTCNA